MGTILNCKLEPGTVCWYTSNFSDCAVEKIQDAQHNNDRNILFTELYF